jgi:hypothetical protein
MNLETTQLFEPFKPDKGSIFIDPNATQPFEPFDPNATQACDPNVTQDFAPVSSKNTRLDVSSLFEPENNPIDTFRDVVKKLDLKPDEDQKNKHILQAAKKMVLNKTKPPEELIGDVIDFILEIAKQNRLTTEDLQGYFTGSECECLNYKLLVPQNESLISPDTPKNSKVKKTTPFGYISAGFLGVAGFLGANSLTSDSGQPSGMMAAISDEPIYTPKALHTSEPIKLNSEFNTFQDLEKYFQQNPSDRSEWSAVYNLIKMAGIQEDLGNKPISIVDFKEGSVPDEFLLGGVQFDLLKYLARIREENVFPPCAFVKSPKKIYFNKPVVLYAQNNPGSISDASLVDVFKSPKNGKGKLLDEFNRNVLIDEFQYKPLTAKAYRELRENPTRKSIAGNQPILQISTQSTKK